MVVGEDTSTDPGLARRAVAPPLQDAACRTFRPQPYAASLMTTWIPTLVLVLAMLLPAQAAAQSAVASSPPGSARAAIAAPAFGAAVAVGGARVFVTEPATVTRPGAVHVYEADVSGRWREVGRLVAPGSSAGDGFGASLDAGTDILLVGQERASGGTVHVYTPHRSGWRWRQELRPAEVGEGSRYGAAVALGSGVAAVGAPGAGAGEGRVYLFRRTPGGWEDAGSVADSGRRAGDAFGASIDLDGIRMLVGSPGRGARAGGALVFRQDPGSGEWSREAVLEGTVLGRGAELGSRVVLGPGIALASAPGHGGDRGAVVEYGLRAADGVWEKRARLVPFDGGAGDRFGEGMAAGAGGAYVGAPGADSAGILYGLRRRDGRWTGMDRIEAPRVSAGGGLGATVAMGAEVAVVGARGEDFGAGAAVILTWTGVEWRVADMVRSEWLSFSGISGREVRCQGGTAGLFACDYIDLLSFVPIPELGGGRGARLTGVRAWVDPATRKEYALVARLDGVSFLDITDPTRPRYLGELPPALGSAAAEGRDVVVHDDHAYIVADGPGQRGIQVFDLTRLRRAPAGLVFDEDATYHRLTSARELMVDRARGALHALAARGDDCPGGAHTLDVSSPGRPTFAGCVPAATETAEDARTVRGTGGLLYHWGSGGVLRVIDGSGPRGQREVGWFDTMPGRVDAEGHGPGASGEPQTPTGTVMVANESLGLFLLRLRRPDS